MKRFTDLGMARTRVNSKPKFKVGLDAGCLKELSSRVKYTGNSAHNRNPGDFGLDQVSSPRPDKTLCDGAQIFEKEVASNLLKEGVLRGLVSEQSRNGFPQQIWAVSSNGIPLEAQLENQEQGTYHGYPLQSSSPLWDLVIERWNKQNA